GCARPGPADAAQLRERRALRRERRSPHPASRAGIPPAHHPERQADPQRLSRAGGYGPARPGRGRGGRTPCAPAGAPIDGTCRGGVAPGTMSPRRDFRMHPDGRGRSPHRLVSFALVPAVLFLASCSEKGPGAAAVATTDARIAHAVYEDSLAAARRLQGAIETFVA